jgi:hypothetical protein
MKLAKMLVTALTLTITSLPSLAAPAPQAFKVNAPANIKSISTSKMTLYTTISGNQTEVLKLSIIAPRGTTISIKEAFAAKAARVKSLNRSSRNFTPLTLIENNAKTMIIGGRAVARNTQRSTAIEHSTYTPPSGDGTMNCSTYTLDEIENLVAFYKTEHNITTTVAALCGNTIPGSNLPGNNDNGGNTNGSSGSNNGGNTETGSKNLANQYVSVVVKKDTCNTNTSGKYVVRVELDFSKAKLGKLSTKEKVVNIVGETSTYDGNTATTIKPVSDGMYAPDPLLLMSSVGSYYGGRGESVELFSFKKGKIKTIGTMKAEPRIVYYRGFVLSTYLIKNFLGSGQRVTAEISSGDYRAYGVCIQLSRTRQTYNGYPDMD